MFVDVFSIFKRKFSVNHFIDLSIGVRELAFRADAQFSEE
jgi:hypothetical protein